MKRKDPPGPLELPPATRIKTEDWNTVKYLPYEPKVYVPNEYKNLTVEEPIIKDGVLLNPGTVLVGTTLGPEHKIRDSKAREEEKQGRLFSKIVTNDNTYDGMYYLFKLKAIFTHQLPNMPREYIARLIMDRKHKSVCTIRKEEDGSEKVIGGIHFREFPEQGFIEIVFCAISHDEQMRGYGTYVMNQLKKYARSVGIYNFLTYADDFAIDYFKRQGFTKEIELDRSVWAGYIKDYEGATMMYCRIDARVDEDYVHVIRRQRKMVLEALQTLSNQHLKFRGFDAWKTLGVKRIAVENLRVLLMTGWNPQNYINLMKEETQAKIRYANEELLKRFKADKDSWPFHVPVSAEEVPDYYTVIKDPIDLQTMEQRCRTGNYYITQEMVCADLFRMMDNCKRYNGKGSWYYDTAVKLENRYLLKWRPVPLNTIVLPNQQQNSTQQTANNPTQGGAVNTNTQIKSQNAVNSQM